MMTKSKEFTGKRFAIIFFSVFGIVTCVNIFMIVKSVESFPGTDVNNAYEESQVFDAERAAQNSLGWQSDVKYEEGEIELTLVDTQGRAVSPNEVKLKIGRATTDRDDVDLQLRFNGEAFAAEHSLSNGKWLAFVNAVAGDGTKFHQVHEICVGQNVNCDQIGRKHE